MIKNTDRRSFFTIISALSAIISTTILIIFLAQGYIPEYDGGIKIKATGIISINSLPKNASVIINDKLYTTTDNSVNLVPGDYQLKIAKEGYLPWNKKITIQKEKVYQADATLFKTNPILTPFSDIKVIDSIPNIDFTKFIFTTPISSTSSKSDIYLVEIDYLSQILNKYQPKFVSQNPLLPTEKNINYVFSPNSKQILAKSQNKNTSYLIDLDTNKVNINPTDYSFPIQKTNLSKLPAIYLATIATNPADVQFSTNSNMIFYSLNDKYYTYDIEKNINNLIGNKQDIINPFWLPNSNNIVYQTENQIKSIEFDGTNQNTIYNSDINIQTIIPDFDGKRIIIKLNSKLYFLTIR
jgi:hypothetical protein